MWGKKKEPETPFVIPTHVWNVTLMDGTVEEVGAHKLSVYTKGLLEFKKHDASSGHGIYGPSPWKPFLWYAPGTWKTVEQLT